MLFAFTLGPMQILLLLVGIVVWKSVTKRNGLTRAVLLGFGLLMLVWLILGFSYTSLQHHAASREDAKSSSNVVRISTEQMWQQLNRPQIKLDDETNTLFGEEIDHSESEEPKPSRPSWVDQPPKHVGNVYRVVVSSGPYKTTPECYHALQSLLSEEVQQRIEQLMPNSQVPAAEQLGIGTEYLLQDLCDKAWTETSEASFGEMKQVYVRLEFTAAIDEQLQTAYRNYHRKGRVAKVGGIAGLGLGSLALLYGLLKIAPGREATT